MTPYKQINKHDPDNGVFGDCYRTCIACLLDRSPSEVPHFHNGELSGSEVEALTNNWLKKQYGLSIVELPFPGDSLEAVQLNFKERNLGVHYLLSGFSKNACNHVVVCKNGKIVNDPAQDDSSITGPCDDGYYWIGFLVKL
jgi:hypothetical protein